MASIKDIMSIDINDFNKMSKAELKAVTSQLASAGNKRLKSFERLDLSSPATRYIKKSGGKFSVKDKSLNELRAEFVRAKNFLEARTGNVRGWRRTEKQTINRLAEKGIKITHEQFNKMWRAYEKLKEIDKNVGNEKMKYLVLNEVAVMLDKGKDGEEIVENLMSRMSEIYERRAEQDANNDGVSGFFEFE